MGSLYGDVFNYLPGYLKAFSIVLEVTFAVIIVSFLWGLIIALFKISPVKIFSKLGEYYITFVRGTPALITIFMIYFGLPQFGITINPLLAGIIALSITQSAYIAEVIRSGINGIPHAQMEAAMDLGCTRLQSLRQVILPQAFVSMIPAFTSEVIAISKNTSLLSAITVLEVTHYTQIVIAQTFKPFEFYFMLALFYVAFSIVVMKVSKLIENKYSDFSMGHKLTTKGTEQCVS